MKMKKDKFIENEFHNYFSGVNPPSGLTQDAKRLILEKKSRRKLAIRISSLSSVFACIILIIAVAISFVNQNKITYYSTAELQVKLFNYSDASSYGIQQQLKPFEVIEFASNANATYRLYYDNNDDIKLIEVKITCLNNYGREDVKIYIETTGKKTTCEDFKPFYELEDQKEIKGVSYDYESQYLGGEWVSKAYFSNQNTKYFIETQVSSVKVDKEFTLEKYLNLII